MRKVVIWTAWILLTLVLSGYLAYRLMAPGADRSLFLLGPTTHGHHQIELSCSSCHTSPFGGTEVLQNACVDCHGDALNAANDSHPRTKFTDPRNANRLAEVDARYCVSCHREHKPAMNGSMGLTLPRDVCFHCHQDIAEERPSHEGMAFDSCANAGCHNYHDNRALYEDFLLAHAGEPDLLPEARVMVRWLQHTEEENALSIADHDAPLASATTADILGQWHHSAHAEAGVNCTGCHTTKIDQWNPKPDHTTCAKCHSNQVEGFLSGMHGMRLAEGLSPMRPKWANLPMQADAQGRELTCTSCHGDHRFDTVSASVEACLGCHADDHSLAYRDSKHFDLWRREQAGESPAGSGVSCATCHMPREIHQKNGEDRVAVQHNQNSNLRPVEAMARDVCMSCHGLGFTLDALADQALRANNFSGRPDEHTPGIEMAEERLRQQQERRHNNDRNR